MQSARRLQSGRIDLESAGVNIDRYDLADVPVALHLSTNAMLLELPPTTSDLFITQREKYDRRNLLNSIAIDLKCTITPSTVSGA